MRAYNENMTYSEEMITTFLELAQEVGITRAKRELGYPKSWDSAKRWATNRGVEIAVDELRAKARATTEWYKEDEIKAVAQEGFDRVHELLSNRDDLTADDMKKASEALFKFYNTWASVQGKAANISESRTKDISIDPAIEAMFAELEEENGRYNKEEKPSITV